MWKFTPAVDTFQAPISLFLGNLENEINNDAQLQKSFQPERTLTQARVARLLFADGIGRRANAIRRARQHVIPNTPDYRGVFKHMTDACRGSSDSLRVCEYLMDEPVPALNNVTLSSFLFSQPTFRAAGVYHPIKLHEIYELGETAEDEEIRKRLDNKNMLKPSDSTRRLLQKIFTDYANFLVDGKQVYKVIATSYAGARAELQTYRSSLTPAAAAPAAVANTPAAAGAVTPAAVAVTPADAVADNDWIYSFDLQSDIKDYDGSTLFSYGCVIMSHEKLNARAVSSASAPANSPATAHGPTYAIKERPIIDSIHVYQNTGNDVAQIIKDHKIHRIDTLSSENVKLDKCCRVEGKIYAVTRSTQIYAKPKVNPTLKFLSFEVKDVKHHSQDVESALKENILKTTFTKEPPILATFAPSTTFSIAANIPAEVPPDELQTKTEAYQGIYLDLVFAFYEEKDVSKIPAQFVQEKARFTPQTAHCLMNLTLTPKASQLIDELQVYSVFVDNKGVAKIIRWKDNGSDVHAQVDESFGGLFVYKKDYPTNPTAKVELGDKSYGVFEAFMAQKSNHTRAGYDEYVPFISIRRGKFNKTTGEFEYLDEDLKRKNARLWYNNFADEQKDKCYDIGQKTEIKYDVARESEITATDRMTLKAGGTTPFTNVPSGNLPQLDQYPTREALDWTTSVTINGWTFSRKHPDTDIHNQCGNWLVSPTLPKGDKILGYDQIPTDRSFFDMLKPDFETTMFNNQSKGNKAVISSLIGTYGKSENYMRLYLLNNSTEKFIDFDKPGDGSNGSPEFGKEPWNWFKNIADAGETEAYQRSVEHLLSNVYPLKKDDPPAKMIFVEATNDASITKLDGLKGYKGVSTQNWSSSTLTDSAKKLEPDASFEYTDVQANVEFKWTFSFDDYPVTQKEGDIVVKPHLGAVASLKKPAAMSGSGTPSTATISPILASLREQKKTDTASLIDTVDDMLRTSQNTTDKMDLLTIKEANEPGTTTEIDSIAKEVFEMHTKEASAAKTTLTKIAPLVPYIADDKLSIFKQILTDVVFM